LLQLTDPLPRQAGETLKKTEQAGPGIDANCYFGLSLPFCTFLEKR